MLKKILIVLCTGIMLVGCSEDKYNEEVSISKPVGSTYEVEEIETKASVLASELVDKLSLEETMDEALGLDVAKTIFFDTDVDYVSDGCVYLSSESGNADTIAVFKTKEVKKVTKALETYVNTVKSNDELYSGQEDKFESAVIESNKSTVILVVCEDSKTAKKTVEKVLK